MNEYLTTKEAAERLGMSEANVRKMCASGRILARRHGKRSWLILAAALEGVKRSPAGRKSAKPNT